jgi:hypothetical protein
MKDITHNLLLNRVLVGKMEGEVLLTLQLDTTKTGRQ